MNPSELLPEIYDHNAGESARLGRRLDDTGASQHFEILCASFGLSLYEVTKSLNLIPASIFLAKRSRLLNMMMKVIPARILELHIVLQS